MYVNCRKGCYPPHAHVGLPAELVILFTKRTFPIMSSFQYVFQQRHNRKSSKSCDVTRTYTHRTLRAYKQSHPHLCP